MQIKQQSGELDKRESYKLTRSEGATPIKDSVGSEIDVKAWVLYEDTSQDGTVITALNIMSQDGEVFTTISQIFIDDFMDIVEHFEGELPPLVVGSGTSRSGWEYVRCGIA